MIETVLLTGEIDLQSFDCGQPPLNEFLLKYALQNQANGSARTYVCIENGAVVGYYSLAAGSVIFEQAPDRVTKGLARHDVPLILMARFAVHLKLQREGLGRRLFFDAVRRALAASDVIGTRAFVVHVKDEKVKSFSEKFGMMPAPDNAFHLFLLFKDIRASLRQLDAL